MHVRLAYSIAIQVDFDILLLDEVLAVGDESFQEKCFETFERFRAEGKTIVLVTHDLEALARLCERALLIERGKQSLGPPDEVIGCYRSRGATAAVGTGSRARRRSSQLTVLRALLPCVAPSLPKAARSR